MSFRGRLRLFFAIIVIVPMIAVAIVLFALSEQSETGKADAGIAAGLRSAMSLYSDAADQAEPGLRRAARDRRLHSAIAAGRTRVVRSRMAALLAADPGLVSIELYDMGGRLVARAGSAAGVAPKAAPLLENGEAAGTLAVSRTLARRYASKLKRLSGLEASVARGG